MEQTKNNFFFFFTQFVHYLPLHRTLSTSFPTPKLLFSKLLFLLLTFPSLFPIHLFPLPNLYYPPLKFSFFLHLFLFLTQYSTFSDSSSTSSATAHRLLLLPTSSTLLLPSRNILLHLLILGRFFRKLTFFKN